MEKSKATSKGKEILRLIVVPWYLLGWMTHVYLGLFSPESYRPFGASAIFPAYGAFWNEFVMPRITVFALLLAVFELVVGCMISGKGRWVKLGLVLSILFCLFLIQMGLSYTTANSWVNFAGNRLPNLLFIVLEIPLFGVNFEKNLPEVLKVWFRKSDRQVSSPA